MSEGAVIIYGRGGELGDFKVFADTLKKELVKKYSAATVIDKYIDRRADFITFLKNGFAFKVKELHIYSHSIGAGLFIGYGDPAIARMRVNLLMTATRSRRKVNYDQVVRTEVGSVLTGNLVRTEFTAHQSTLQSIFDSDAFIKIWGCNSAVKDWVYHDEDIVDPVDTSVEYYWRALNEQNSPKPSIAQAFADFFKVKVFGASSGANIQVLHNRAWTSSQKYKDDKGRWPSGTLPHRLVPEVGVYDEYKPVSP